MTYPEYVRGLGMSERTTKELIILEAKSPAAAAAFGELESALRSLRIYEGHVTLGRTAGWKIERVAALVPSRDELHRAKALSPSSIDEALATINRHIGTNFMREGTPEKGVPYAKKAVELQPGHFDNYAVLGGLEVATDKISEGVANLKKAVDLQPDNQAVYTLLARAYATMFSKDPKSLATEVVYLEALQRRFPNEPIFKTWLGITYIESNQLDKAVALLKRLGIINEANAGQYLVLAGALLESRPKAAIPVLEKLAQYLPIADAQVYLGVARQRSGQNRLAEKHYLEALRILGNIFPAKRMPEDWAMMDRATNGLVVLDKTKYKSLRAEVLDEAKQFGYKLISKVK